MFYPIDHILAHFRHPEAPPERYAALSDIEIQQLTHLVREPGYTTFLKVLDYTVTLNAEGLISPQTTSEARTYLSGLISGLRRAGTLVDEILSTEQRREHTRIEHPRPDRASAFNFSPASRT